MSGALRRSLLVGGAAALLGASAARAHLVTTGLDHVYDGVSHLFKDGGRTYFTSPRSAVLRSFVMSHLIHHRAQLGVYLRLRDVPLPSCYGPTADTRM